MSPKVTIALPTFRRGDNGLLRQCIESLLAQTFQDFELIIVDDASVDSTRAIIGEYLAADPRVATIRHGSNVGLPTISCNEAILRGRGADIFFAFDDDIFEPDALETLWNYRETHPEASMVYGVAHVPALDDDPLFVGKDEFDLGRLRVSNTVPNCGVLIDRRVFETVGLYDPHISMIRIADWDLWLRVARHFEIHRVDRVLVTELGRTQSDSLGNSQVLDPGLTREWLSLQRDRLLLPEHILDYDVGAVPDELSALSRAKIRSLLGSRYGQYLTSSRETERGYLLLVAETFYDELSASFLAESEHGNDGRVVLASHALLSGSPAYELIFGASCVVLEGAGELTARLGRALGELGFPYYVFLSERAFHSPTQQLEQLDRVVLNGSAGLLVSSEEALGAAVRHQLHPHVRRITPLDQDLSSDATTVESLIGTVAPPTISTVMHYMNEAIVSSVPTGYFTPREFASALLFRLRHHPLATARNALRRALRIRPADRRGAAARDA